MAPAPKVRTSKVDDALSGATEKVLKQITDLYESGLGSGQGALGLKVNMMHLAYDLCVVSRLQTVPAGQQGAAMLFCTYSWQLAVWEHVGQQGCWVSTQFRQDSRIQGCCTVQTLVQRYKQNAGCLRRPQRAAGMLLISTSAELEDHPSPSSTRCLQAGRATDIVGSKGSGSHACLMPVCRP